MTTPGIERRLDPKTGIIHVAGTGVWTRDDVDGHYTDLRKMIAPIRMAGDRVRLLSDVTRASRQAPEIEQYVLTQMLCTFLPGDRVAFLTATVEDKKRVRTLLHDFDFAAFNSLLPAEMWLLEDDMPKI